MQIPRNLRLRAVMQWCSLVSDDHLDTYDELDVYSSGHLFPFTFLESYIMPVPWEVS